ncbi:MAG: hypothetical protein KC589_09135 [Nanoarchaeota archaeon]|nr:hypothetical protein [Nanoarchaeota archaeon]
MIEFSKELLLGIIVPILFLITLLFRLFFEVKKFRHVKTKKKDFIIPILTVLLLMVILGLILYLNLMNYLT